MAKVINMFSSMDEDMKDYHKKIWKHRLGRSLKYIIVIGVVILGFILFRYYLNNRTFTGYSVVSATERIDTLTTKYAPFHDNILKYGRDGVAYTDEKDSLYFSIAYTMQNPMLVLNEKMGAVAEKNGSQIYVFDQSMQRTQINTLLPIKHIAVSNQGVVAVLMEESDAAKLEVYSAEGQMLGDGIFSLEEAGYPMNLSISDDGTKIAITFAQITGTKFNSCVAVYNFDNVGENYVDHLVFAKNYSEYMIPELHYFDESVLTAVGDGILAIYQGNQIPEVVKEVTFEDEIKSVFYGEKYVGLVFETKDGRTLRLFDLKGNQIGEVAFDINHPNIRIEEKVILIYNDSEMGIYSYTGKECFRKSFDTSVVDIFPTKFRSKYLIIYPSETQLIKLQ